MSSILIYLVNEWSCFLSLSVGEMMVVAGDFTLGGNEGTEQFSKAQSMVPHPMYNKSSNNADIMLIKVQHCFQFGYQRSSKYFLLQKSYRFIMT